MEHGDVTATRRILTILSNGISISTFPIQNRSPPSDVRSTDRTELYQNQATAIKLPTDTETTVPCAPIGTAATSNKIKIVSRTKNLALKPVCYWDKHVEMKMQRRVKIEGQFCRTVEQHGDYQDEAKTLMLMSLAFRFYWCVKQSVKASLFLMQTRFKFCRYPCTAWT
mmetsp:Transcript_16860/g.30604  ORF Transcript_16860/g.30604 Transcript_16860/m.30604 type:complete len:168 (+) Transcript_16860:522-1025(+)